jgi:transposase
LRNPPSSPLPSADKGYDKENLRTQISDSGSIPMIPRRCNSKVGNADMDWYLNKHRHLVENQFAWLKHYRAVATRYDKLKRNFEPVVAIACAIQWLPM